MRTSSNAHPMLEPLNYDIDPEVAKKTLDNEQSELYRLLWNAAVATNIDGPVTRNHQLTFIVNDKASFTMSWYELIEKGWSTLVLFPIKTVQLSEQLNVIPPYQKDSLFSCSNKKKIDFNIDKEKAFEVLVHKLPQPTLNYASLIQQMARDKVGRPSTYASAIAQVIKNNFLFENNNHLHITSYGQEVFNKVESLPIEEQLTSDFSYQVESAIEEIEKNPQSAGEILNKFCNRLFNTDSALAAWLDDLNFEGISDELNP